LRQNSPRARFFGKRFLTSPFPFTPLSSFSFCCFWSATRALTEVDPTKGPVTVESVVVAIEFVVVAVIVVAVVVVVIVVVVVAAGVVDEHGDDDEEDDEEDEE